MKKRDGVKIGVKEQEIEYFDKYHFDDNEPQTRWNGRQIRNTFHVAIALAENDALEKALKSKYGG
jgi:hypothetical protein